MKAPAALLALALLASGCRHVDARKLDLTLDEIATVGSEAKVPGPRSSAQVARIESQVVTLQKRVRELAE